MNLYRQTSDSTRSWRGRAMAVLACLAIVAGACGGDDGDEAGNLSDLLGNEEAEGAETPAGDDGSSGGGSDEGADDDAPIVAGDLDDWGGPDDGLLVDPGDDVSVDVELADETRVVPQSAVRSVSGDHTYQLDADAAASVEPGSVLLVPGTALRRVVDVRDQGGTVEVTTEFAALTDAFDEADISWDVALPVDERYQTDPDATSAAFDQPVGMGVTLADGTTRQVAWSRAEGADLPLQWTYSENGFTYVFALGVGAEHMDVRVQVTRDVGGGVALAYVAEGQVRMPRSSGDIQIREGELSAASIQQRGLEGDVELTMSAAGAGKAPIDFEMPGIWFKYIVPIGPIPLTIDINARIIGDVEIPAEASAQGEARYTFGGDMGFELTDGSVEAAVRMPDMGLVPQPADSAAMFGNYVNAEFGLAFPHMSVSLFDQGIVPRIFPGMILGSRLQWGPLCKSAYVNLVVQGSYDFKILGVNLLSGDTTDLIAPKRIDAEGESCEG